ncbi:MAG: SIS domain-containing protein, partial [Thermaerobacter sp.]|nr:SIS domain-containing protein [Thermaerobacter sp.]
MIDRYFQKIDELLNEVYTTQKAAMEEAATMIAQATTSGHSLFAFGCSHSSLLIQDIYYRAGTFMLVNPLFGPGMSLSNDFPPTKTSAMERMPGLGEVILKES